MENSKRNEFVGELAGTISHEMKESISGIFSCLDQMDEDLREGKEDSEMIDIESLRNQIKIIKKQVEGFSEKIENVNFLFEEHDCFISTEETVDSLFDKIKFYNSKELIKKGITMDFAVGEITKSKVSIPEEMIVLLVGKTIESLSKSEPTTILAEVNTNNDWFNIKMTVDTIIENVLDLNLMKEIKKKKALKLKQDERSITIQMKVNGK